MLVSSDLLSGCAPLSDSRIVAKATSDMRNDSLALAAHSYIAYLSVGIISHYCLPLNAENRSVKVGAILEKNALLNWSAVIARI